MMDWIKERGVALPREEQIPSTAGGTRKTRQCPLCRRQVSVTQDGILRTHGPGTNGAFVCRGSGDTRQAQAAAQKVDGAAPPDPTTRH